MTMISKTLLSLSIATSLILPLTTASADEKENGGGHMVSVSITNISPTSFTPPMVALCKRRMDPIATLGEPASEALSATAEGGDTSGLQAIFTENNCAVGVHPGLVGPGETVTIDVPGRLNYRLHLASMLLPTNDGFIYSSGHRARYIKRHGLQLNAYDAGTEFNDELCANIPGPQCQGSPFSAGRELNNFVRPHPGIQGFADVSAAEYNWGDPVALIHIN